MTTEPSADEGPQPVLAQLVFNSMLATWLVRTVGRSMAILIGLPAIGGLVSAFSGESSFLGLTVFLTIIVFLVYLNNVSAPLPDRTVTSLLDGDLGSDVDETP